MADYEINVPREILQGLLTEKDVLAKFIEGILNQVLEAQMSEHLKAKPYERSDERQGYRNGSRIRTLATRVGPLTLIVPQSRDGSFSSEIFKRYQRSEQAFVLALMEMVIQGVSTRKVKAITEELCGHAFSRTTVSRLTAGLDRQVQAFASRTLDGSYPFLMLDAMFLKVRESDQVVSKALLVAIGINADGFREVLGFALGDSESFIAWDELLKSLKVRGLKGVAYVISDQHTGLARAIQRNLQGAVWQRCQIHLMRNVLGYTPPKAKAEVAEALRRIFSAPNLQEARRQVDQFLERLQQIAPKALGCLADGLEDALGLGFAREIPQTPAFHEYA